MSCTEMATTRFVNCGARFGLIALLCCLPARTSWAADEPGQRLNVLFIAVDDLNTRLHCYGHRHIHSPAIDRLAARGIRFDRAYCQYPSCGPSRASLLTGLRPDTTGVHSNRANFRDKLPDVVTLPQLFKQHGYYVARVGKIFHQAVPTDIGTSGLDDPRSWDEVVNPRGRDKEEEHRLTVYTPDLPVPDRMSYLAADGSDVEQTDGKVVNETIRLLEKHREQPFFIAAGLYRPHIPYIAPTKYFDLYDLEQTVLPELSAGYRDTIPGAALASTPVWPNFGTTRRQGRECVLAYDACVSFADAQVGRLLAALDRLSLTDRTIVVLWGDHGYHLGEHGMWRKNSLFEESARAPLVIAAPQIKSQQHDCPRIVEFVDIYPTVAALAGLEAPPDLAGVSLVPLLRDPNADQDRPAFTQVHFKEIPGRSVRTQRWRFTQWDNGRGGEELYDERNDPQEMQNLAGEPEFADVVVKLRAVLQSQQR